MTNDETNPTPEETAASTEPEVPAALRDVDPEKLALLKQKLAAFIQKRGGAEGGPAEENAVPVAPQQVPQGRDVEWGDYDLDYNLRHLYPKSVLRDTPQGPKWVAVVDEFYSTTRSGKQHGTKVNAEGPNGMREEPLNLGDYLNDMTSGAEGWKIAALLPGSGSDVVVLLQRQLPIVLPDPRPLKTEDPQPEPTDDELAAAEAAALKYATDEGLAPDDDDTALVIPEGWTRPSSLALGDAMTEAPVPPRIEPGTLERVNLELNATTTDEAPQAMQPDAVVLDDGRVIAAGIEHIRQSLPKLEDFGTTGR